MATSRGKSNTGGKGKPKGVGGRPRDPTPEELENSIKAYFAKCEAEGRFPTESGMLLYLGWVGEKGERLKKKPQYSVVLESASLYRQDWLENKMVTDGRCANGCMNALKQEKNGGYVDKTQTNNKQKSLKVIMTGVGGKEAAG